MKKTKIVATIGPRSESREILKQLSESGVNIFRMNFSHGSHEEHGNKIDAVRSLGLPGAMMLDTKGPEIRTGEVRDKVFLKVGDKFTMTIEKGIFEDTGKLSVNYDKFTDDVEVGDIIVFDSGVMLAKALKKTKKEIDFEVVQGQTNITTKRHINLFGKPVSLPTVTEQDWNDIDFGIKKKIDMIALSFVRTGKDIKEVKEYCAAKGHKDVQIIAKIENFEATQNLEDIVIEADGVMVARGDLACETPYSKVPALQKKIIALCSYYHKPVIVATQMLLSMVDNINPTRAEVSDVANAIFEHADAIMTSDETTKGIDPVNVIKVMSKIATDTEEEVYGCDECGCEKGCECCGNGECDCGNDCQCGNDDKSGIISILPEYTEDADAIVVIGNEAAYTNAVSSARLNMPILSFTNNETLKNNLHLVWNVRPYLANITNDFVKNIEIAEKTIKSEYKNIKNYILVFEINGVLTVQMRNI